MWLIPAPGDMADGATQSGGSWTSGTAIAARDAISELNKAIAQRDGYLKGQSVKDFRAVRQCRLTHGLGAVSGRIWACACPG